MNKVDIIRKHIGNDDFYDMNGTSMLTNILNAMEEYKEQEVKNCSIPDVVGRSEQLKAEVFTLANKLAIAGEGHAAVAMHRIHNRL